MTVKQKYAVIGLGRFGGRIARVLTANGAEVIAIDRNIRAIEAIRDDVTIAVRADSTDENALVAHGVDQVDAAIVGIGDDFESAVLTVTLLKSLGINKIYARARSDVKGKILSQVGATVIVNPEREAAYRWAHRLMLPDLKQYVELDDAHSLITNKTPAEFVGKSLIDLNLRAKYGVNLVAIQRTSKDENEPESRSFMVPFGTTKIEAGDILILVGSNENIAKLPV